MSDAKPWDITDAIDDAIDALDEAHDLALRLSGYGRAGGERVPALVDLAARLDRIAGELHRVVPAELHERIGRAPIAALEADEATTTEGRTTDR